MIRLSTRLVIIMPTFVVKIPLSKRGYLQSKNEKFLYNGYKKYHLLGRLYWECMGIVCMKKYKVAKEIRSFVVHDIKHYIRPLDIENCDLNNPKNWGYNKHNDLLLIDYGINDRISKMYKLK